jgi:hypothetical protein
MDGMEKKRDCMVYGLDSRVLELMRTEDDEHNDLQSTYFK